MKFAFDFFNTLNAHEDVRELARMLYSKGHEVHIVSAISPSLQFDYETALDQLKVPFTEVHRVDHSPELKVKVLLKLPCAGFWDDLAVNVDAARMAGIPACLVGIEPAQELRKFIRRRSA